MQFIIPDDFELKEQEIIDKMTDSEKMWMDKSKVSLQARIEVLVEKINEMIEIIHYINKKVYSHKEKG